MPDKRRQFKPATEAELDRLSQITPEDVERARVAWRRDASPEFKELLDAEPLDTLDPDTG